MNSRAPGPLLSALLPVFLLMALAALALGGCGGPAQATPTAIPASVVRPVQPTPQYARESSIFSLLTPGASPQFVPTAGAEETPAGTDAGGERAAIKLYIENQTPSATGIAPGGSAIYAERGGRVLASVPVGGVLTVTGKSADGSWYAVYNDAAVYGWAPAGQLRVYGGEDLVVVEEAPDPAPVATLLAQAAQPVEVLDGLMAQFEATATALAQVPVATPTPAPTATPQPPAPAEATPTAAPAEGTPSEDTPPAEQTTARKGTVTSEGRLNLRAEPDTAAAIVRKLDPGDTVTILEGNAGDPWLRVQLEDGETGWVSGEFVTVN
jgi:hypothetical protein